MSEPNAPEPTMEEILASIRRIISEDDAPAADAKAEPAAEVEPAAPAAHEPAHEPEPHAPHEDVLELTQRVEAFAAEPEPQAAAHPEPVKHSLGDLDFTEDSVVEPAPPSAPTFTHALELPEPPPAPKPPAPASAPMAAEEDSLVSGHAADRAADHFGSLAQSLAMPAEGRTLEDLVSELMRPMLKAWLDQHLSTIVETRVQAEVERISRTRR